MDEKEKLTVGTLYTSLNVKGEASYCLMEEANKYKKYFHDKRLVMGILTGMVTMNHMLSETFFYSK